MKPASMRSLAATLAMFNTGFTKDYQIISVTEDALDSPKLWMRKNLPSVFAEWDEEYWYDLQNESDAWEGSLE